MSSALFLLFVSAYLPLEKHVAYGATSAAVWAGAILAYWLYAKSMGLADPLTERGAILITIGLVFVSADQWSWFRFVLNSRPDRAGLERAQVAHLGGVLLLLIALQVADLVAAIFFGS